MKEVLQDARALIIEAREKMVFVQWEIDSLEKQIIVEGKTPRDCVDLSAIHTKLEKMLIALAALAPVADLLESEVKAYKKEIARNREEQIQREESDRKDYLCQLGG
jgi:hypothetical protein